MEKHNTHILLESFSSERHDYEVDENGNIKLEENEDAPYHSFIQKKGKMSIKEILIENNNTFKKELEKIVLSEEKPTKSKKKRKKIDSDVYVKAEEYRFNEKKIKPCFNEVGIEYKKNKNKFIDLSDQEMDNKNLSQEIIGKNRNFNDDKIKYNLKRKRYTMNNLEYENKNKKTKEEFNINLNNKNEENNLNNSNIIKENINNNKEKDEIINTDKSSEAILLKDKIIYKDNESKIAQENINKSFNDINNINKSINSKKDKSINESLNNSINNKINNEDNNNNSNISINKKEINNDTNKEVNISKQC